MQGLQKQISITFFQTLEDLKSKENLSLFFADFLSILPNLLNWLHLLL